jgi:glutamyl-tRNA reductase
LALQLIGLNHHTTPVALRERLYLRDADLTNTLTELQRSGSIESCVILSTCNRLELYFTGDSETDALDFLAAHYGISTNDLRSYLYHKEGQAAVEHLLRVASGLDSLVLGETQILGQVSAALQAAVQVSTSDTMLHRLFEVALFTGKRARTETAISQASTSVSHAAAMLVHQKINLPEPHILVLGAGEMAELAVFALHKYGYRQITVLNRTFDHAQVLAEKFALQADDWSTLWQKIAEADVVITATGAPNILLYMEDMHLVMNERSQSLMLVDIAVPRNIAPEVAGIEGIHLYDIDALKGIVDESLALRQACIPQVEALIHEETERYLQWLNERNIVPVIRDLRRELSNVIDAEVQAALQKLPELSESELAIIKRMAHRITNKLLHTPTTTLREHAAHGNGSEFAAVVRELFDLSS